jgi:hypothetical protein
MKPSRFCPTLPHFNGLSRPSIFLQSFAIAATASHFSKEAWLSIILAQMQGTAWHFASLWQTNRIKNQLPITGIPAYEEFTLALETSFSTFSDETDLENRCRLRKQLPTESVQSYFLELLFMLNELNETLTEKRKLRFLYRNTLPEYKDVMLSQAKNTEEFLDIMIRIYNLNHPGLEPQQVVQAQAASQLPNTEKVLTTDIKSLSKDFIVIPRKRRQFLCNLHGKCNHSQSTCLGRSKKKEK